MSKLAQVIYFNGMQTFDGYLKTNPVYIYILFVI